MAEQIVTQNAKMRTFITMIIAQTVDRLWDWLCETEVGC